MSEVICISLDSESDLEFEKDLRSEKKIVAGYEWQGNTCFNVLACLSRYPILRRFDGAHKFICFFFRDRAAALQNSLK